MASNSDSIFYVLSYIRRHPDEIIFQGSEFNNVITMGVPDTLSVSNPEIYFPTGHLRVNRMADDFVTKQGDLLEFFYDKTAQKNPAYREVWITTGHLPKQHRYLVELSFE